MTIEATSISIVGDSLCPNVALPGALLVPLNSGVHSRFLEAAAFFDVFAGAPASTTRKDSLIAGVFRKHVDPVSVDAEQKLPVLLSLRLITIPGFTLSEVPARDTTVCCVCASRHL